MGATQVRRAAILIVGSSISIVAATACSLTSLDGYAGGACANDDCDAGSGAETSSERDAPDSTPCTDTQSDSHHCGSCGHDCLGGACNLGVCQPAVLLENQADARFIVADETNVYWYSNGTPSAKPPYSDAVLWRMGLDGKDAVTLSDKVGASITSMVHDRDRVYMSTIDGRVVAVAKTTGAMAQLATSTSPLQLAPDPDAKYLYWANGYATPAVLRVPLAGGAAEPVVPTAGQTYGVTVDATSVYWNDRTTNTVKKAPKSGCAATASACVTLWQGSGASSGLQELRVDDGNIYFDDYYSGAVYTMSKGGGAPATSKTADPLAGFIVDSSYVYWSTDVAQGSIYRAPKAGGGLAEVLATKQVYPSSIAVNSRALYWTARGARTNATGNLHDAHDATVVVLAK